MNSQEQSALSTTGYVQIKRSTVLILAIACGLSIANVYYNQPLLADIGRSLNISVQEVGFIPTLTQIGYALGLLLLVPLGDKLERRKLIVCMLGLLTFALIAAATSVNLFWLSVSSFVLGFSSIVAHVIIPLVAQMTDPKQRGQVIGTLVSGLILSVLLARTFSGGIGQYLGWRAVYLIAAGLMVVVAFVLVRQIPASRPSSTMSYPQLMQSLVHLFRQEPVLRQASFNIALIFGSFNAFWATLVFMLESPPYHYNSQVAGLFGLVGIAGAIITPTVGRLADKWGSRILVGVATILALSAFVVLWVAGTHLMGLIIGVLALDIAMHTAYISNQIRVYNLIPNAESRLNTVYMVTNYSGGALGSFLGTYCWAMWQWNGVCSLGFILLSIAAIAHFSIRNKLPTVA